MDFLQKYFDSVFELPLPRNAQKRTKKKVEEKKSDGGWVGLGFFAGPSHMYVRRAISLRLPMQRSA
jgi:hypothetical protein